MDGGTIIAENIDGESETVYARSPLRRPGCLFSPENCIPADRCARISLIYGRRMDLKFLYTE
jgi:hypothetical protein